MELTLMLFLPHFHSQWKRQRRRFIFKPDQIGAFEYNDTTDM